MMVSGVRVNLCQRLGIMEKNISGRFDFANRLYWWVPPAAVITAIGIDDLIAVR